MSDLSSLPEMIGRYRVEKVLGSGAMGSVVLAEDPKIKRKVAIKVMKLDQMRTAADQQEFLARFQREAEVSGLLNHPGIVAIYDVGETEGFGPFLAMEFVQGQPLDHLIGGGGEMALGDKFRILVGVAEALDHAHSKGIVHRDVKPGNIMVAEDGRPKLMDFGIAKREDASLTQTGIFLGTPSYASPEQIKEGRVDNRSDLFSFGVVAFELLSGQSPFPGTSINTILYRIVNEPPVDLQAPVTGILPAIWRKTFEKVLAKRPEDRHASCSAFVRELLEGSEEPSLGAHRDIAAFMHRPLEPASGPQAGSTLRMAPGEAAPPGRSRLPWLAAAALILCAGGGFLFLRGRLGPAPQASSPQIPVQAAPPGPVAPEPAKEQPREQPKDQAPQPAKPAPEPSGPGTLKLAGGFPVSLKLDGKDHGEVAVGARLQAPAGTHRVELSNSRYYFRETRSITLSAGQGLTLTVPGLANLTVDTNPGVGKVYIDGQDSGIESDGSSVQVAMGRHTITVRGARGIKTETVDLSGDKVLKLPF